MALQIRKATKKRARLRMNIEGQPGGGKTYTSLLMAKLLIGEPLKLPGDQASKIVLVDSERSSAELYADEWDFGHIDLPPSHHGPKGYIEAVRTAEDSGAEVIILDSITHEWKWCLAEVDRIKPKFGGNKWSAWSEVRPPHDDFIDAMMGCGAHLIATTRAKPATAQEQDDRGKTKIVKLGLEGIQDDMLEFAFGIVMRMDGDHNGIITKTRCRALSGKVFPLPGEDLVNKIRAWLDSGDPTTETAHTLSAAVEQALKIARDAAGGTKEAKTAAWRKAQELVVSWCRGHGRSEEETARAIADLTRRVKEGGGARAAAADTSVDAAAPATPRSGTTGLSSDDAAQLAAIDQGRA